MGYYYEKQELRYTYGTSVEIMNIVRASVPSLESYEKLGHSREDAKRCREAKIRQDTNKLLTFVAALKDCFRVQIDKETLLSFFDNLEDIEADITKAEIHA